MNVYLQNLAFRNFRTFGQFDVGIAGAPGLVVVTGPNGLGKSTFFDAIEWGLTSKVQRFKRHLAKADTEAAYLTRDGQEAFSHGVRLTFTEGNPIERRGDPAGAKGNSDEVTRDLLVSPQWGRKVENLSTYLALTHFLGQGSQQRLMSLDHDEQWEVLREPAGVQRLENIHKRLRGRSATMALNKKAEAAAAAASQDGDRLARWDALVERLRPLEGAAEAAGALSEQQEIGRTACRERV